jgi:hypothetical protein
VATARQQQQDRMMLSIWRSHALRWLEGTAPPTVRKARLDDLSAHRSRAADADKGDPLPVTDDAEVNRDDPPAGPLARP